jgi:glucose-1-phosphate thymidylyltransferase
MYGLLLAGGLGTRLQPLTRVVNKHLLPVFDKPLIYYPLATLMLGGIKEITVICRLEDLAAYQSLLGDGSHIGIQIKFETQPKPGGVGEAFLLAESDIEGKKVALILGDNIFHGAGMGGELVEHNNIDGALAFAYQVANPEEFGIVELNEMGHPIRIIEKPQNSKTDLAIPGLYFFDEKILEFAHKNTRSFRGELEITSILEMYMNESKLRILKMRRGTAWLDTGTMENLYNAATYVKVVEERQGLKIACIEEISWRKGWITSNELEKLAMEMPETAYKKYLSKTLQNGL